MNIGFVSLGCSKNRVDTEIMIGLLKQAGYKIVDQPEKADIVIINTCGFITSAQEESINTIIALGRLKHTGLLRTLIATGCLAQRFGQELLAELPELDAVVGISSYLDIVSIVKQAQNGKRMLQVAPPATTYIEKGPRVLTTPPGMAYLKIAEGCNSFCSYCTIPLIRGRLRSFPLPELIQTARHLVQKQKIRELVLIAQDTAAYGQDLAEGYGLPDLLEQLADIEDLQWIRLLYLHPHSFSPQLINAVRHISKVVPYLDIPIQHISDSMLQAMHRRETSASIRNLLCNLRDEIPQLTLRTTIMTGFPGETEADFDQLVDFLQEFKFDWLGVFAFDPQNGTHAYRLEPKIPLPTAHDRREQLLQLQQPVTRQKNIKRVGSRSLVLLSQEIGPHLYIGRTAFQAPEVDGLAVVKSQQKLTPGTMVEVLLKGVRNYDMIGEAVL